MQLDFSMACMYPSEGYTWKQFGKTLFMPFAFSRKIFSNPIQNDSPWKPHQGTAFQNTQALNAFSCQYTKQATLAFQWFGLLSCQIKVASRGSCISRFSDQSTFERECARIGLPSLIRSGRRPLTWQILSSWYRFLKEIMIIQPQATLGSKLLLAGKCWTSSLGRKFTKVYYFCFRSNNGTWEWALHDPFVPNVICLIC